MNMSTLSTVPLKGEKLITLKDVIKLYPPRNGKRLALTTVIRWIIRGCRGRSGELVKLEAIRNGNRWLTSDEALDRFNATLTAETLTGTAPHRSGRSPAERRQAHERAEAKLKALGY